MNIRRTLALAHKEWREILRDRLFFALAFIVPCVQVVVIGMGLTLDVTDLSLVILDQDRTALSREFAYRYIDSRYFALRATLEHDRAVNEWIQSGRASVAIVLPPRFQERLLSGRPADVQVVLDGTYPNRSETAKGYVAAIGAAFSDEILTRHVARTQGVDAQRAAEASRPLRVEVRYLYNEGLRSQWGIAPATMMLALMICPPLLTAVGVVREKESGSIDNIYCSTLSRGEFVIGKLAPYAGLAALNIGTLWLLVLVLFGVPFRGNPALFVAVSLLYVVCTTGMGMVVSLLVRSQIAAILVTVVVTLVPTILYAGLLTPTSSLSPAGRVQSEAISGTHYNRVIQGSFLKGVGLEVLWPDVLALVAICTILLTIGYAAFTKRPRA